MQTREGSVGGRDGAAILGLGALCLLYFWRVLRGRVLVPWDKLREYPPWQAAGHVNNEILADPVQLYAPWRTLLHNALREGRIPTWDPYVFGGAPFLANSQAAVLYPPNLLYGLLPVQVATTVLVIGHTWLAAAGMYLLARCAGLRLRPLPALLASVGFAFCGFAMVWAELPTFGAVYAWLPWMLLFLLRTVRQPTRWSVAGLAITVALAALGGHAQVLVYCLLAVLAGLVVSIVHVARLSPRRALRALLAASAGLGLGLALAAPQLLSTLEAGPLIVRGREPLDGLLAAAFPVHLLPLVALPHAWGSSAVGTWIVQGNENEYVAFAGLLCLFLAPVALFQVRRVEVQVLLAIEVLAWGIALGTPLFTLLYHVVPGLSQTRGIGRATALHMFALPLLAAVGLQTLSDAARQARGRRWLAAWGLAVLVTLPVLVYLAHHLNHDRLAPDYMRMQYLAILLPALIAVPFATAFLHRLNLNRWVVPLVPLVLFAELYMAYGDYNTAAPGPDPFLQPNPIAEFLQAHPGRFVAFGAYEFAGNTAIPYGLSTLHGSDSFILRTFADYFNAVENHEAEFHINTAPPFQRGSSLRSPLLANAGVRWVVTQAKTIPGPGGTPTAAGQAPSFSSGPDNIFGLGDATAGAPGDPLLRILNCMDVVSDEPAVLRTLTSTDVLAVGVTADPSATGVRCPGATAPPPSAGSLAGAHAGPNGEIDATADMARPGVLEYAEMTYPGWWVTVDGHQTHLLRIDHALMGVTVPAGRHRVAFGYRPTYLAAGGVASGLAVLVLLVLLGLGHLRRGPRSEARPPDSIP